MSTLATLAVNLTANTAQFQRAMTDAEGVIERVTKGAGLLAAGVGALAGAAAIGGLTAAVKGAVDTAANFQQALADVGASTNATAAEMAAMKAEALGIGKDTSKSAGEAVEAMGELARAGMNIETVVGGAARSVVQFAEATKTSTKDSATILSNTLNTFKKDGLSAAEAANLIAKAVNASSIETHDYATALQAVGPVAAQAGLSAQDFATAIALMGNNALKGSDAGTSLKTMLMRLTAPGEDAKEAMQRFGIEVYDAEGRVKPFRDILSQLQTSFADGAIAAADNGKAIETLEKSYDKNGEKLDALKATYEKTTGRISILRRELEELAAKHGADSIQVAKKRLAYEELVKTGQAQGQEIANRTSLMEMQSKGLRDLQNGTVSVTEAVRNNAFATLFGTDAIRAANILVGEGAAGWDAFQQSMAGASDIAEQSRRRLDTLPGILEQISGTIETMKIHVGDLFLPEAMARAAAFRDILNSLIEMDWQPLLAAFARLGETTSALTAPIGALGGAIMTALFGDRPTDPLPARLAGAVDALNRALGALVGPVQSVTGALTAMVQGDGLGGVDRVLPSVISKLTTLATTVKTQVQEALPHIVSQLQEWGRAFVTWVEPYIPQVVEALVRLAGAIAQWVIQQRLDFALAISSWARVLVEWVAQALPDLIKALGALGQDTEGWVDKQAGRIAKEIEAWQDVFQKWVAPAIPKLLEEAGKLAGRLENWIQTTAPQVGRQLQEWGQKFVDWVSPHIQSLLVELGKLVSAVWDWISRNAEPIARQMLSWAGEFLDWVGPLIPPLLVELGKLIDRLFTWVMDQQEPIRQKVFQWAGEFVDWVAPRIGPLLTELGKLLAAMLVWITTTALPRLISEVLQWNKAFIDWVLGLDAKLKKHLNEQFVPAFYAWIDQTAKDLPGKFGAWAKAAFEWAGSASTELLKALDRLAGELWGWISRTAEEWKKQIQGAFKIEIPMPTLPGLPSGGSGPSNPAPSNPNPSPGGASAGSAAGFVATAVKAVQDTIAELWKPGVTAGSARSLIRAAQSAISGAVGALNGVNTDPAREAASLLNKFAGEGFGRVLEGFKVINDAAKLGSSGSYADLIKSVFNEMAGGRGLVPRLARGGLVTSPTLATIGERGPEAVIPLNRFAEAVRAAGLKGDRQPLVGQIVIHANSEAEGRAAGRGFLGELRRHGYAA